MSPELIKLPNSARWQGKALRKRGSRRFSIWNNVANSSARVKVGKHGSWVLVRRSSTSLSLSLHVHTDRFLISFGSPTKLGRCTCDLECNQSHSISANDENADQQHLYCPFTSDPCSRLQSAKLNGQPIPTHSKV